MDFEPSDRDYTVTGASVVLKGTTNGVTTDLDGIVIYI